MAKLDELCDVGDRSNGGGLKPARAAVGNKLANGSSVRIAVVHYGRTSCVAATQDFPTLFARNQLPDQLQLLLADGDELEIIFYLVGISLCFIGLDEGRNAFLDDGFLLQNVLPLSLFFFCCGAREAHRTRSDINHDVIRVREWCRQIADPERLAPRQLPLPFHLVLDG